MSAKPPPLPACAKPSGEAPPPPRASPSIDPSRPTEPRPWSRSVIAWLVSLLLHQSAIILLALWAVAALEGAKTPIALLSPFDSDLGREGPDLPQFALALSPIDLATPSEDPSPQVDLLDLEAARRDNADVTLEETPRKRPADKDFLPGKDPAIKVRPTSQAGGAPAEARVREARSVEEALGGVVGEIEARLREGDLLVVWLFDASVSMDEDRPRVAARLDQMFQQHSQRNRSDTGILMNAVVAFGAGWRQLVAPTAQGGRIVKAATEVPSDPTGLENTFGAVQWAVNQYGKRWHGPIMVVIWTDESGDDVGKLEASIALCRERNVSVSVMGPSAILSRDLGTQAWTHGPTGRMFLLPVHRGPDTALLERVRLPYWHETRPPLFSAMARDPLRIVERMVASDPWQLDGPAGQQPAGAPGMPLAPNLPFPPFGPWYGGEQLEQMVSGYGPYALTRLTVQTRGSFTIFDRPADRGPFSLATMGPYRPDYRAVDEVARDIQEHPLRRAVTGVAVLTAEECPAVPQLVFFASSGFPLYYSPPSFRHALRASLERQEVVVRRNLALVEKALALFGPGGMEVEYGAEDSPRWRAWHDLTRGRLLAIRVRNLEYAFACKALTARLLDPNANFVRFHAADAIRSGPSTERDAREARRLLDRCVTAHRGTPWQYLAERELDYPLGIDFQQTVVPPPVPQPATPAMPAGPAGGPAISVPKL